MGFVIKCASRVFLSGSVSWNVESQIRYSREFFALDNYALPIAEYTLEEISTQNGPPKMK